MIENRKVLALIPARGGSKRLPDKNILPLDNKPLIAWTIEAALASKYIDRVLVTTDSDEIAKVSKQYGAEIPFIRPGKLSADETSTNEVIQHFLEKVDGDSDEIILILQPTSPLRLEDDIDRAIELLVHKKADGVVSVCECDHSPLWCNTLPENNSLGTFLRKEVVGKRSQDLPTYYRLNGAIYSYSREALFKHEGIHYSDSVFSLIMSKNASVDIDDLMDFRFAEVMMSER